MNHSDIFVYPPQVEFQPLEEEYLFAIIGAAHSHIIEMAKNLIAAGATLCMVYDQDPMNLAMLRNHFPGATVAKSVEQIYEDRSIRLIATAGIPSERATIAITAMRSGKDCMTDKAPLTTLDQLCELKATIAKTKRKYSVFYGESIDNDAALYAYDLVRRGMIGRLCYVNGAAPHRLNAPNRAPWFFQFAKTGGLLTDLLCHQIHQFLLFLDAQGLPTDVELVASRVGNLFHRNLGELQDYGDAMFSSLCGVSGYFRVDWNSPTGLSSWGDSRMVIGGEDGMIELRKNCDIARDKTGNHVYLVNQSGEFYENVSGKVQRSYFPTFIRESIQGYTDAHRQKLELDAIELTIRAQHAAITITQNESGK